MKKRLRIILLSMLSLIVISAGAFFIYASDYNRADDEALAILQSDGIIRKENLTVLLPDQTSDTALIFYPGAKVEYTAYLPILNQLRQHGIACVLMEMPFNMAIFAPNAADRAFSELSGVKNWYIGGHSMGGAMASSYAAGHQDKVKGLVLLGAYIYGDVSPENALTVYGSLNSALEKHIDYTENIVIIEGGNHAQFGNYGEQKGDLPATISREEQQDAAVEAIVEFVQGRSGE